MDRRDSILKHITREQRGIEIGPWFNPLAPKREGYNCLTLDVFDAETLRRNAAVDPSIDDRRGMIEEVDFVGSTTHIDNLVAERGGLGTFDYIISSHNFEHIPNPIRFLQGSARVLKPGGIISMAIPDRRACFDYFRPITTLSEWIDASLEDRNKPTMSKVFDGQWVWANYDDEGKPLFSFHRAVPPRKVSTSLNFVKAFDEWIERRQSNDTEYHDAHCSVFTPSSFELLIRDSAYLGLVKFEVVETVETPGNEFHAHLRLSNSPAILRPSNYETERNVLLQRIQSEAAESSGDDFDLRLEVDNLRQRVADLTQIQISVGNERKSTLTSLDIANNKILELEATISALHTSNSWRVTAPIRRVMTAIKR